MRELRPHQVKAIDMLKASIRSGKRRPLIQMATGGGKTLTAAHIIAGALAKGKRVTFCAPAIELIDQTVSALASEGIHDVGVIQARHPLTDASQPIQVASVQSLVKRDFPDSDIVIVDEAHVAHRTVFRWMERCPDVLFIGLSATPWTKGLGKHYDDLIVAATTQELIDAGYLSPFRVFAPSHPDLSGVRTVAGDYQQDDLSEAMSNGAIVSDIVSTWLKLGNNEPTICFAVDRAHAMKIHERFEAAGVRSGYMDGDTDSFERRAIREAFHAGDVKVVCNVGVLVAGVDWDVRCLILARPTKSEMRYVQQIGRALRTAPGKEIATILDHSDTTLRLGFVTDILHNSLDMGRMKESSGERKQKTAPLPKECPSCAVLKPAGFRKCPSCGFEAKPQPTVEEIDGELKQVKGKKVEATIDEKRSFYGQLLWEAEGRGYKRGWAFHKYKERFGVEPASSFSSVQPEPPTGRTLAWLKSRQIAWAKGKQKREKMEAQHAAA